MNVGGSADQLYRTGILRLSFPSPGASPVSLTWVTQKRWLGQILAQYGKLTADLHMRTQIASNNFASLLGLVNARALPISAALRIFETKVDGALAPGRWLYTVAAEAEARLNSLYDAWARSFINADSWRNAAVAHFVLGWCRSGYGRAVEAVARRRARLWLLPNTDFYKGFFIRAHHLPGDTWAKKSLALLQQWGIDEVTDNINTKAPYYAYCRYVRATIVTRCAQCWRSLLAKHVYPLPLANVGPVKVLHASLLRTPAVDRCDLVTLFNVRAYCRVLAGTVELGCKRKASVRASVLKCHFCPLFIRDPYEHVLCRCKAFAGQRFALMSKLSVMRCPGMASLLSIDVESDAFSDLCALLHAVDCAATSKTAFSISCFVALPVTLRPVTPLRVVPAASARSVPLAVVFTYVFDYSCSIIHTVPGLSHTCSIIHTVARFPM